MATPVEIIRGKGPHRVDTHIFARRIRESWCAKKGCRFYGKPAVQGVCHTTTTFAGDEDYSYWEHLEKVVEGHMVHLRKMLKGKTPSEQRRRLESEVACALMNGWGQLDELIRLRRDTAILRDQVARLKRRRRATHTKSVERSKP